ncbi:MAG: hypothetical protein FWE22_03935 [Firmicutes bacterium]|nr:hypothetical protein [Bacillota bacterium]
MVDSIILPNCLRDYVVNDMFNTSSVQHIGFRPAGSGSEIVEDVDSTFYMLEGFQRIGARSFRGALNIEHIKIPASVIYAGADIFYWWGMNLDLHQHIHLPWAKGACDYFPHRDNAPAGWHEHWDRDIYLNNVTFHYAYITIQLDAQSGIGGTTYFNIEEGEYLPTNLTAPTRAGFLFDGFFELPNGQGQRFFDGNMGVTYNAEWNRNTIRMYAHWRAIYTITLDYGTGSSTSFTIINGDLLQNRVQVPTRLGYTFGGFFSEANGQGIQFFNQSMTAIYTNEWQRGSITMHAHWTVNTFIIQPRTFTGGNITIENNKDTGVYGNDVRFTLSINNNHMQSWNLGLVSVRFRLICLNGTVVGGVAELINDRNFIIRNVTPATDLSKLEIYVVGLRLNRYNVRYYHNGIPQSIFVYYGTILRVGFSIPTFTGEPLGHHGVWILDGYNYFTPQELNGKIVRSNLTFTSAIRPNRNNIIFRIQEATVNGIPILAGLSFTHGTSIVGQPLLTPNVNSVVDARYIYFFAVEWFLEPWFVNRINLEWFNVAAPNGSTITLHARVTIRRSLTPVQPCCCFFIVNPPICLRGCCWGIWDPPLCLNGCCFGGGIFPGPGPGGPWNPAPGPGNPINPGPGPGGGFGGFEMDIYETEDLIYFIQFDSHAYEKYELFEIDFGYSHEHS